MGAWKWVIWAGWLGMSAPLWAGEPFAIPPYDPAAAHEAPGPTPLPAASPEPAQAVPAAPTEPGSKPPLRAPDWTQVRTTPGALAVRKDRSPWVSLVGLGADLPSSPGAGRGYAVGFDLDLGTGYRLDDDWSLWANASLGQFSSRDDALTRHNNLMVIEGAVWAKVRLSRGAWSPYLFAGPGLAYNENRDNRTAQYDPLTGYYDVPVNRYEVDFVAEGGLGLDWRAAEGLHLFLQGRFIADFTSSGFASYASTDSPLLLTPVEFGLLFGY